METFSTRSEAVIPGIGNSHPRPLTPMERGMYLEQMMDPDATSYNLNLAFFIEGAKEDKIRGAIRDILASHEIFHSRYGRQDDVPCRIPAEAIPEIKTGEIMNREDFERLLENPGLPFNLEKEVPLRLALHPLSEGGFALHFQIHHIAFDGTSIQLFVKELAQRLLGNHISESAGGASEASPPMEEQDPAGLAFFKKMFEGGVPVNEMPTKCARPKKQPVTDTVLEKSLDSAELSALSNRAKQYGVTLFQLFLGISAATLGKYCASEDVVLGIPVNARTKFSANEIGMFVNTVPVRIRPGRDTALTGYFAENAELVRLAAKEHRVPFETLVREFCPERDASRNPLYDMSVNYLWLPEPFCQDGLTLEFTYTLQQMPRDLGLVLQRQKDSLKILLQYSSELYDKDVMENFLEQFAESLRLLAHTDAALLRDITKLPAGQEEQLAGFSQSARAEIPEELLHRVFEAHAAKAPDRTALIACDRTLTYGELNSEANRAAAGLMAKGIKRGDSVILLLPRRSFYFSAMFGVLKAGAAFIPCDPEYPAERIAHILRDSGASFILTTKEHFSDYAGYSVLDIKDLLEGEDRGNPDAELTGEDLAYMIYTSGSTGVPKGVMLRHRGICNYLLPHPANLHYDILSRRCGAILSATTVSFDMSLKETTGALCNGKTLVFASEEEMNDPRALSELFRRTGADCFNTTPSRMQQYLEYEPFREALSRCRLVICGAEGYPLALRDTLKKVLSADCPIINTYGPTEITVSCNAVELTFADHISVGRPLLNVEEYIVDAHGEIVPRGVTGELLIGGPGVALGYRNLDEQTAKSFITYRGGRFYRSGDFAKWDADGNVMILGRMDGQVKLRGLRIELGEIEAVMEAFPGIRKAVAAVKEIGGREYLCAYYVSDEEIDEPALICQMQERLTDYMVPKALNRLERIPVNANGKTDRKALPVPELTGKDQDTTAPATETEKKVYSIVAEKTGTEGFGIHVPLSELGVTSLSMVGLMLALSDTFGRAVSIPDIKEHGSVAKLAAFLDEAASETVYELREEYPLTQTQYGIYVECVKAPDSTIYNIPSYLKLSGGIDLDRLEQAIICAIDAHPYLKMHLVEGEDGVYARRQDSLPAEVKRIRAEQLPGAAELLRPYDLLKDTLYRMEIYETPEGNALYMDLHHIAGDGESRLLLQRDIERAYAGESLRTEAFTGYEAALAEEDERKGPRYEKAKEWYASAFGDAEASTLPPAQPEKGAKSLADSVWHKTGLDADALEDFCRQKQITLSTLFNAAYGYTLAGCAWSEEAVFTTIFNGRSDSRLAGSVTMLVKTLPVRLSPEPSKDTAAFLTELHTQLEKSTDSTVYSFGEISRNLGIRADTMLCFQGKGLSVSDTVSFCGEPAKVERPALSDPKTLLTVEVYVQDGGILLRGEYATASYDRPFVEGFLRTLTQAAKELTRAKTLGEISLMYDGAWEPYERENQTNVPVDIVSVNRLFEEQVRLHPEKTAVIAAGESLTFDELNRRANRVAHALIELGICRDSIVGMVLDRTKEIFIAEHGILKAGGAFLPMVPEYPDERIRYCLLDAESLCVITTEKIKAERPELFAEDQPYRTLTVEELTASGSEENPNLDIPVDSLAYCIYTSGSTGNPKGVMIEHRNMCNYLNANPRHPAIYWHTKDNHCALSVTSISFDMSITERFVSMCNGVTLCMATLEEIHDPRALARLMLANGTESIVCTPSYLMSLLDEPAMLPAIAALKAYHVGGEAFPSTLIDRLKELNPNSHVMNGYGPTETSVCCTSSEILPGRPITIGKPEANVTHYVADRQLRPVPKGVCGELIICGAGVGRGYVKLPERTAAAFFTFRGEPAYHSGDLVRLNDEGEYDYYGRLDNQVKLRGLRIELDEIETVMLEYPGVKLTKVIVRNNGKEDYLAGFYTAEREIPAKELKAYLKGKLTPYMVPDALAQLAEMPLTINGKIDKKKLPDIRDAVEAREYEPPANETEEKFCSFFAKVLKLEKVGATDNFFEIGGTSLSAAMVVSRAARNGFDVVYKNVFDYPTPRMLAEFIGRSKPSGDTGAVETPKKETVKGRFHSVLCKNRPENLKGLRSIPPKAVLLTGATGFLGIHVLRELLQNPEVEHVICLVRGNQSSSSLSRIRNLLMYYFEDPCHELLEQKVTILNADITNEHLQELLSGEVFDMIINCAAVVKHFETGDLIRRVNYDGVVSLIDVALSHDARLIQISTLSVSGAFLNSLPEGAVLKESACDLGQITGTKYSTAKLEAEKAILDAVESRGLRAKIIRVGNLMGRRADGEFQINFRTNGFMNRLKAYKVLGCFPIEQMDSPVEFSPVDLTARAVVLLAGTEDRFTVFHANNCHSIHFANVLEAFAAAGYPLEVVEDDVFEKRFAEALENEALSVQVSSLVSYNSNAGERKIPLPTDNSFTVKVLYRLGFSWPPVSLEYLELSINALSAFDFFED